MADEIVVRSPNAYSEAEKAQMVEVFDSTGFFYDFELDVVSEMIESYDPSYDLHFRVAVMDNRVVGVAIFDEDCMSRHSWNLYWIAVHKDYQGKHIGKALLNNMETFIARKNRAHVYIETCSRPLYEPTRQFYLKNGYILEATLKDYYAEGDSKCIFSKELK